MIPNASTVGGILMCEKEVYEAPSIEITEFELTDSIALSTQGGFGTGGVEEIWGS
jgi:hypothetical protein